jgi:hypothetical protein
MLAGGYSWRLFFYVEAAFAAALLIMAFLFMEESAYHRPNPNPPHSSSNSLAADNDAEKGDVVQVENSSRTMPPRKTFLATLKPWSSIDPDAKFFLTMLRSFSYFFIPAVFWVIASYGKFGI